MIAIDTCVLIWAIKSHSQPGREEMIARAKALLADHRKRRIAIMVPSIALAEYLADFSESEQEAQRSVISRDFFIAPFDTKAAWTAGELFDREKIRVARDGGTPRQCIHADLKIIATAIAHGAGRIYTDNTKDFKSFGGDKILVDPIPEQRLTQQDFIS